MKHIFELRMKDQNRRKILAVTTQLEQMLLIGADVINWSKIGLNDTMFVWKCDANTSRTKLILEIF